VSRVMPRPAARCPQCQLSFSSADLMLDHLNADHLRHAALNSRERAGASNAPRAVLMSTSDAEVADLERMLRRPWRPRVRRVAIVAAIAALLLIAFAAATLG
jgi:hypothetical protein